MKAKERDNQIKIKQKDFKKVEEKFKKQDPIIGYSSEDQYYSDISEDEEIEVKNLWGLHPKRSKGSLNPFTEQGQDDDTELRPRDKLQSREETK